LEKKIQIRAATPDDTESIASVLYQSFIEYKSSYTEEGFAATTPTGEHLKERLSEGPVWVATLDETIISTVGAVPKADSLYIRGMAALPAALGQGIGELLLKHVETFARAQGFERLSLSTTPFLDRAIKLYERAGFLRTNDGPHDLFGTPLFTMVKVLK
jgi:GNAT superfamily N-acetyltransferase